MIWNMASEEKMEYCDYENCIWQQSLICLFIKTLGQNELFQFLKQFKI